MGGIATVSGRGRKPKPTALRRLNGNAGKRPLNKNEPQFNQVVNILPPDWLPDLARMMWQMVVPELLNQKVLTAVDLHNVEAFCVSYARWRQAEAEVETHGMLMMDGNGKYFKNPAFTIINETKKQMIQFGSLLGLDPSSRTRLTGSVQKEATNNPFADL